MHSFGTPPVRYARVTALATRASPVPAAPTALPVLIAELSRGMFAAAAMPHGRGALAELRACLFTLDGEEARVRGLWQLSLATGALSGLLARVNGARVDVASLAGLLHRAGDAAALRTLPERRRSADEAFELPAGARVTGGRRLVRAADLAREWQLPAEVVACLEEWHRSPELEPPSPEIAAVYCGQLLAVQLLHPERCAEGTVGPVLAEHGFGAPQLARVTGEHSRVRELLRALG